MMALKLMKPHLSGVQIAHFIGVVLVGCGNPETDHALIDASREGNIEAVQQHLASGTDVNAKDNRGRTPLLWAAFTDRMEIAELLIAKGADVNAKSKEGKTPLDRAINKEVADLLRKHGGKTGEELKDGGK
jgi:ankyrin repeat protein